MKTSDSMVEKRAFTKKVLFFSFLFVFFSLLSFLPLEAYYLSSPLCPPSSRSPSSSSKYNYLQLRNTIFRCPSSADSLSTVGLRNLNHPSKSLHEDFQNYYRHRTKRAKQTLSLQRNLRVAERLKRTIANHSLSSEGIQEENQHKHNESCNHNDGHDHECKSHDDKDEEEVSGCGHAGHTNCNHLYDSNSVNVTKSGMKGLLKLMLGWYQDRRQNILTTTIITVVTILFRGLKRIEYGVNTNYLASQSFFSKSNLRTIYQQYRFTSYDAGLLLLIPAIIIAIDSGKSYLKVLRLNLSALYAAWIHHEKLLKENKINTPSSISSSFNSNPSLSIDKSKDKVQKEESKKKRNLESLLKYLRFQSRSTPEDRAFVADRVTWMGIWTNLGLFIFKLIGGVWGTSTAMVADAFHTLSDLVSDGVTLWTVRMSSLPPDADHPYGHGKFEALGSLVVAFLLLTTGWHIGSHSYDVLSQHLANSDFLHQATLSGKQLLHKIFTQLQSFSQQQSPHLALKLQNTIQNIDVSDQASKALKMATLSGLNSHSHGGSHIHCHGLPPSPTSVAVLAAIVSIVAKELLYQVTARVGIQQNSQVLIANAWHHRSDAISSLMALGGILAARAGLGILDPLTGLLVTFMITLTGFQILLESVKQLSDSADQSSIMKINNVVALIPGIKSCNNIRARSIGSSTMVDLVIVVDSEMSASAANQLAEQVRWKIIQSMPFVSEVLIRFAAEEAPCPLVATLPSFQEIETRVTKLLLASPKINATGTSTKLPAVKCDSKDILDKALDEEKKYSCDNPIKEVVKVDVSYTNMRVTAEVLIELQEECCRSMSMYEVEDIAKAAKSLLETNIKELDNARIYLDCGV